MLKIGKAVQLKARNEAAFVEAVRWDMYARYREYIMKATGKKLTTAQSNALETGVRYALLSPSMFESVLEYYHAGATVEYAGQSMYLRSTPFVRKTRGLAALYKRASMLSAAAYAASPESEAYWAS